MATRILEYTGSFSGGNHPPCLPSVADVVQELLTASGTSQQSADFANSTTLVVVDTDEAIHVAFGSNPTATNKYIKIAAGACKEFNLTGRGQKAAIIQGT